MSSVREIPSPQHGRSGLAIAVLAVGAAAATAYGMHRLHQRRTSHPSDSAPGRTSVAHQRFGDYAVVGHTVTIGKSRDELYSFWRDFANLPKFMENVRSVEELEGDLTRWTIAAPFGQTVDLETRIVEDRPGQFISWRSTDNSEVDTEGSVSFTDAPNGRGTEVEALIAYKPPGGEIGRIIAKLFQREPKMQGRRELKRLKMLMETGEVADSRHTLQDA